MRLIFKISYFIPYLIPVLFAYLVGFDRPATYVTDSDLLLLNQALCYSSTCSNEFNTNESNSLSIALLSGWFKLSKYFSFIEIENFTELFAFSNPKKGLETLILNTRVFGLIVIELYIFAFHNFLKVLRIGRLPILLGLILLTSSEGILSQSIMYRVEPLSCLFFVLAVISIFRINKLEKLNFPNSFKASMQCGFFAYLSVINDLLALFFILITFPTILIFQRKLKQNIPATNNPLLLLKYIFVMSLLFLFLIKKEQILVDGVDGIAISQTIFLIFIFLLSALSYFKSNPISHIIGVILGGLCGISAATQINYLDLDWRYHLLISSFYEQGVSYAISTFKLTDSKELYYIYLCDFISSLIAKFHISWLLESPTQITFIFTVFFFFKILKKENWSSALGVLCYLTLFLISESFIKLIKILPVENLISRENFHSIASYKIYFDFFLITGFGLGLHRFLKIHSLKQTNYIFLMFVAFSISSLSILSTYEKVVKNRLSYVNVQQTPQLACEHLLESRLEIYYFFGRLGRNCEEGVKYISKSDNS